MHSGVGAVHPHPLLPAAGTRDPEPQRQTHARHAQARCDTQTFIPGKQKSLLGIVSLSQWCRAVRPVLTVSDSTSRVEYDSETGVLDGQEDNK